MSIFDRFRRSRAEPVSQEDLASIGDDSWTGIVVDQNKALGLSAVWACVRVLSETLASLPLFYYQRIENGKEKVTNSNLYDLLHLSPNPEQTAFQFKEQLQGHLCIHGNGYAQKRYDKGGQLMELWPLDPQRMHVSRSGGQLIYEYHESNGQKHVFTREDIFHIPGLGFNGITGFSVIELLRQELGLAIAAKRYGSDFYKNDAHPGGVIQMPGRLKDEAAKTRFKKSWQKAHDGWGDKHSVAVLEDGAEWKQITIPPDDAQFIESMKFSTTEIARIFRVPPHLIADLERATFSNIEHQGIEFVVHTMRPWLVRWEQALSVQLLDPEPRKRYFWEFSVDALLRGDVQARWQAYRTAREIGVLNVNEIRSLENMNPVDGGDEYVMPMNWVPVGSEIIQNEPVPDEAVSAFLPKETRQKRSATARHRIANAYEKIFRDGIARIVTKEARDISNEGLPKLSNRAAEEFELWLGEYYRKLPDYIKKVMTPMYRSLSESVKNEIADEIDIDGTMNAQDEDFITAFVKLYVSRHIGKSQSDIRKAMESEQAEAAVQERLDDWTIKRSQSESLNETVRGSNAFARNAYMLAGVISLRWVSLGAKSCPFCSSMDGRTVGIQEFFEPAGGNVSVGENDMHTNINIGHPPLHRGCVCQIVAG